jgi:sporulation protein YlmC with PRC-barrel domain
MASVGRQSPDPAGHGTLDVALRVLGQQVVDWAGRRCGRVDDVEFEGAPGEPARLAALLIGVDHLLPRLPAVLRPVARLTYGWGDLRSVRVPWEEVDAVTHVVKLRRRAGDLGLVRGDDSAGRLVRHLPRA